jgi:Xaa-Pro aminopeptidase
MDPLSRLRERIVKEGVAAILIAEPTTVSWLTGFTGTYGRVIVAQDVAIFITDSRYTLQAQEEVKGFEVFSFASPVDGDDFLDEQVRRAKISQLGFDAAATPFGQWKRWVDRLAGVELTPIADLSDVRLVKFPHEVEKLRQACALVDAAFDHVQRLIQPGVTEWDICLDLEFFLRRQGAEIAFPMIVVSGERSARPHGKPSEKKLEVGDFVTMDFGAKLHGYNSDITRTVVVGEALARHREVYGAVLEAQLAALDAVRPGVLAKDVDKIARDILASHDLAQFFGHGLGHGLGLLVHDGGRLSPTSSNILEEGQVWTIEPGVYIPGFGGVRIEDDVVVTGGGCEILTKSTKDLLVLPSR